ncbi:hypothetical protein EVG20_g9474 [Dentipellis fragilis]|uniref:Uncharacterized protein n=1 Tax=Dentipellis fragilis TaxID=205917 RepID=A0A4Y9XZ96_9AGAM|nr:hypothetical protein EVG20_g9474 [Dentipellis fragilis]
MSSALRLYHPRPDASCIAATVVPSEPPGPAKCSSSPDPSARAAPSLLRPHNTIPGLRAHQLRTADASSPAQVPGTLDSLFVMELFVLCCPMRPLTQDSLRLELDMSALVLFLVICPMCSAPGDVLSRYSKTVLGLVGSNFCPYVSHEYDVLNVTLDTSASLEPRIPHVIAVSRQLELDLGGLAHSSFPIIDAPKARGILQASCMHKRKHTRSVFALSMSTSPFRGHCSLAE